MTPEPMDTPVRASDQLPEPLVDLPPVAPRVSDPPAPPPLADGGRPPTPTGAVGLAALPPSGTAVGFSLEAAPEPPPGVAVGDAVTRPSPESSPPGPWEAVPPAPGTGVVGSAPADGSALGAGVGDVVADGSGCAPGVADGVTPGLASAGT